MVGLWHHKSSSKRKDRMRHVAEKGYIYVSIHTPGCSTRLLINSDDYWHRRGPKGIAKVFHDQPIPVMAHWHRSSQLYRVLVQAERGAACTSGGGLTITQMLRRSVLVERSPLVAGDTNHTYQKTVTHQSIPWCIYMVSSLCFFFSSKSLSFSYSYELTYG